MSRDALVVVDMQVGLLDGLPKHDLTGVIQRINAVAAPRSTQSRPASETGHLSPQQYR